MILKWPRDSRNLLPLAVRLWLRQYKSPVTQSGFLLTPDNIPQDELWERKYTYGYFLQGEEFVIDLVLVSQKTGLVSGLNQSLCPDLIPGKVSGSGGMPRQDPARHAEPAPSVSVSALPPVHELKDDRERARRGQCSLPALPHQSGHRLTRRARTVTGTFWTGSKQHGTDWSVPMLTRGRWMTTGARTQGWKVAQATVRWQ